MTDSNSPPHADDTDVTPESDEPDAATEADGPDADPGTDGSGTVNRRNTLKLLEAMGVASLAGCLGGDDGGTPTASPTEEGTPTESATDSTTEGPTPTDDTPTGTQPDETETPPEETETPGEPTDDDTLDVLFLGGPEGGSHNAPARSRQIVEYLQNRGINVVYTDRQDDLQEEVLHRYDAWMLFDNRSNLTQAQEDSLISFVEDGGGFVALHSASACFTGSSVFIEHLGGQFESHGYGEMTTDREQPDHPVYTGVEEIVVEDETYRHTNLNSENEVLAYGDFPDYGENEEPEPWTWVREEGDGRVFYTAWGHGPAPWAEPGFKKLVENAIRWTSGNEDTIAEDTSTLEDLQFSEADVPYYPPGGDATVPEEVGSGQNWNLMQEPISPERSAERIITPEGFDAEPFVTEEDLPDDVEGNILDFDFDHRGRVYLAMSQDYPNAVAEGRDSIVIAEDTDGDGRADEFTVFKDGLSIPNSIAVGYGGVYVANTGHTQSEGAMLFVEDTNGDDQADETTVLFSGYSNGDTHAGPNELVIGVDNWIWGQVGYSGFSGTVGGTNHSFGSAIYRFRPDGSELQVLGSLPGNQAGIGFDEMGLAFASAATTGQPSNYLAIPAPEYDSIDSLPSNGYTTNIAEQNRFLPATDRVRQVDWHGEYTAAAGQSVYTARQYPEKYWNSATFVSDGTGHLLGSFFKEPDGAGFTAPNPHNVASSTDAWVSPTYSYVGPDGIVWFADLYEYIFQHNPTPSGFENGEGNAYETMLRDKQYTRLYRLTYGDNSQGMDLGDADTSELVDALSHDNMFWRRTAQRLLVDRGETDIVSDLIGVVENDSPDDMGIAKGAVHALWTLDGLGVLEADGNTDAVQAAADALGHDSAAVRMTAARVLPPIVARRDGIMENNLLEDDSMHVRMWALLGLAETPSSDAAGEAIYEMISAEENSGDSILVDAASIAGATHSSGFISAYEANEDTGGGGDDPSPNLFTNPGFEQTQSDAGGDGPEPADWGTTTYTGTAEHTYDQGTSNSGSYSVQISSSEGSDASWNTTVSVEQDTEYTLGGYIKTENLQNLDDTGFNEDTPLGAAFNVDQVGGAADQDVVTDPITGTTDWTEVSVTINSGSNSELTVNCLFGGFGESTGTAWYDDIYMEDPDGNNVLPNTGFESQADTGGGGDGDTMPAGWETNNWAGAAPTFTHDSSTSRNGDYSVAIESSEGSDSSWTQVVEVEPNAQYEFSAYVKTGENFAATSGFGALINIHELQQDPLPEPITEAGTDWTEVSVTLSSGSNEQLQFNLLFGGWGNATGTAWWDDVSLRRVGGGGGAGAATVYNRVTSHVNGN